MIAKGKLALTRRELQEIVILTSKLTTQLGKILTTKVDHLFSSFGISYKYCDSWHIAVDKKKLINFNYSV